MNEREAKRGVKVVGARVKGVGGMLTPSQGKWRVPVVGIGWPRLKLSLINGGSRCVDVVRGGGVCHEGIGVSAGGGGTSTAR